MKKKALQKAIKVLGSQTALAKALGVTQTQIWNWLNRDSKVTAEYVLSIEKLTGVPRHELRPDIYPPEEYKKAS
jgi:DNA-binding transcriptional regulator YdaS (Cro superfamily)